MSGAPFDERSGLSSVLVTWKQNAEKTIVPLLTPQAYSVHVTI
jgi:hypothetical protein